MINYHDLYVSYVLNHKKAPAKYCFALRTKNLGRNLSLKNPTPTDFVCRILCSETSSEREAWMAAIIQAKVFYFYFYFLFLFYLWFNLNDN